MSRTYKRSPEVRQRMSEASKRAWALKNPELAQLSTEQLKVYRTLRAKECTHEEALEEALREVLQKKRAA